MKYEANTKTARNQAVRDYAKAHPELSMKEVGEVFKITKQRVWQILNAKNHATPAK
jgi:hypothetical protein